MENFTLISPESLIDIDAFIAALKSGQYTQVTGSLERLERTHSRVDEEADYTPIGNCCLGVYARQCLNVTVLPTHEDEELKQWSADFFYRDSEDDYSAPDEQIYLPDDHWLFTPVTVTHPENKSWVNNLQDLVIRANDNFGDFDDYRMVIPILEAFRDGQRAWKGTWSEDKGRKTLVRETRLIGAT